MEFFQLKKKKLNMEFQSEGAMVPSWSKWTH